jgi:hypothetical protein
MTPYLILLGLALTAFGRMAHGFRRPIWVVWGSLFIGASFTMAYVAYEAALEPNSDSNLGPGIHVLILVVVIGTPTFVLSIITGLITVGFRIVGDRRITRAKTGCLNCGYLRAGLSGPVCPECGNAW